MAAEPSRDGFATLPLRVERDALARAALFFLTLSDLVVVRARDWREGARFDRRRADFLAADRFAADPAPTARLVVFFRPLRSIAFRFATPVSSVRLYGAIKKRAARTPLQIVVWHKSRNYRLAPVISRDRLPRCSGL